MAEKLLNVRLTDREMARLQARANRHAISKSAMIRRLIASPDVPTAGDAEAWIKRNAGNKKLRIEP